MAPIERICARAAFVVAALVIPYQILPGTVLGAGQNDRGRIKLLVDEALTAGTDESNRQELVRQILATGEKGRKKLRRAARRQFRGEYRTYLDAMRESSERMTQERESGPETVRERSVQLYDEMKRDEMLAVMLGWDLNGRDRTILIRNHSFLRHTDRKEFEAVRPEEGFRSARSHRPHRRRQAGRGRLRERRRRRQRFRSGRRIGEEFQGRLAGYPP